MKIREGYMPFKEGQTYYRITGENNGKKAPVIFLHGGPGSTHNYFEVMDELAEKTTECLLCTTRLVAAIHILKVTLNILMPKHGLKNLQLSENILDWKKFILWDNPGVV